MPETAPVISESFKQDVVMKLGQGKGFVVTTRAAFLIAQNALRDLCVAQGLPFCVLTIHAGTTLDAVASVLAVAGVSGGSPSQVWRSKDRFGMTVEIESSACEGSATLTDVGSALRNLQQDRRGLMVVWPAKALSNGIVEAVVNLQTVT